MLESSHVIRDVFAVDQDDEDEYVHEIVQNFKIFKTKCFLQNFSCFFDVELVLDEILVIVFQTISQQCHDFQIFFARFDDDNCVVNNDANNEEKNQKNENIDNKNDDDEFFARRFVEILSRRNVINFDVDDRDIHQQIVFDVIS